ncbi:MAG: hypothetical protein AB8F95_21525 [Bacteroidia bacterium]
MNDFQMKNTKPIKQFTRQALFLWSFLIIASQVSSQDPNRIGFGGIGTVGDHYTARDAILSSPARIAAGANVYGQFVYSVSRFPFLFTEGEQNQTYSIHTGYGWESGHAIGVSTTNFSQDILSSEGLNLNIRQYGIGYRYKTKNALSYGLALTFRNELRPNLRFPDQIVDGVIVPSSLSGDYIVKGLTVNLGVHKSWITRQTASGYNQFELGGSLTNIGGRQNGRVRDSLVFGARYPGSQLSLGLSAKRHITLSDERTFLEIIFGYQITKNLTPSYDPGENPATTILGTIFDSFAENKFGGGFDEMRNAFGIQARVNIQDFRLGLSSGLALYEIEQFRFGIELAHKNFAFKGAFSDTRAFITGEKIRIPYLALDWHIPIKQ